MVEQHVTRILVCEDSPTFAAGLTRFLEQDPDLRVIGQATSGAAALTLVPRIDPDLVLMDLELEDGDGTETVRRIMERHPRPIIVLSAYSPRGSRRAAAALAAGAVDALAKTDVSFADPLRPRAVALRRQIKRLSLASTAGRRRPVRGGVAAGAAGAVGRRASVIAVAASTGGPVALEAVLSRVPAGFAVPVLVVQHITSGFLDGFVDWLDERVALPVRRALDGSPVGPGVWFAPEGAHLVLDDGMRMRFDTQSVAGYHRPAADVLLSSVARVARAQSVSVVLTGMGSDGAAGTAAIRSGGGLTIAQDQASSVLYGMPRAAAEAGAELILPLEAIGPALSRLLPVAVAA